MNKELKPQLPLIVKIAIALTFFNSWVLFEETVVDRHGLWQYMPLYRVGNLCVWDVVAMLVIVPSVWYALHKWLRRSATQANGSVCFLKFARCFLCCRMG